MGRRASSTISVLEEHPNLSEILGVLAQLAHVRDDELPRLAAAWCLPTPRTPASFAAP